MHKVDYSHYAQEVAEHAIWHQVGHLMNLGSFATGVLGGLLSFQTLGEKDSIPVPTLTQALSKPLVTKCWDQRLKIMNDCIILSNGREVVGEELLTFAQELRIAQIVKGIL